MLCLFPFEPAIYDAAGVPATYVGHPLADTFPLAPNRYEARERLHLPQGEGEAGGDEGGAKQEKGQHSHTRSRVQATVGGGRGWPPSLLWVRSGP